MGHDDVSLLLFEVIDLVFPFLADITERVLVGLLLCVEDFDFVVVLLFFVFELFVQVSIVGLTLFDQVFVIFLLLGNLISTIM